MHIPDGFLSLAISLLLWALTIVLLAIAVRRSGDELGERQIPLMGVMAAFIFAAQLINFPVAGGTSGHLLGGALAAITLGPWPAMLVMASVIGVQGLLFQDGGLVVMGANIFNMGLLTALTGYGLYRGVLGRSRGIRLAMAGALTTALQLWLSGTASLSIVVPAMLGVHALIGIGEALITVAALAFILRTRPDLLEANADAARGSRGWVLGGIAVAVVVVLLAPLASTSPDGLERVAGDLGFLNRGQAASYGLIPDYTIPFLGATPTSTIVAGLVGIVVVGGLMFGVSRALRRRPQRSAVKAERSVS
jgi:cobalt/nickel transport system permease protein